MSKLLSVLLVGVIATSCAVFDGAQANNYPDKSEKLLFQCPSSKIGLKLHKRNLTVGELEVECVELEGEIEDKDITDSGVGCTDDCLEPDDAEETRQIMTELNQQKYIQLYYNKDRWGNWYLDDMTQEENEKAAEENFCERECILDDQEWMAAHRNHFAE